MNEAELDAAYKIAARPYLEAPGPIPHRVLKLKSWRYIVEVNSACNLRCILCASGNRTGYEYTPGIMDMDLLDKVLDKIRSESEEVVVCCYANSEPMLHPDLPAVIRKVKERGLGCEISTNLHTLKNAAEILEAKPDYFTISVSGFSQDVYGRTHRGGDVEKVKENLKALRGIYIDVKSQVPIRISYHKYEDNQGEEMEKFRAFGWTLTIPFEEAWARAIILEPTVQALRSLEGRTEPFTVGPDGKDWNTLLPPADPEFIKNLTRLHFHPAKAREFYERFPVAPVCLISEVFTYIRHDGRVQLCPWVDDMRMTLGNYLDMSQADIAKARLGHPFCQECLRYRLNLYFHIVDWFKWADLRSQP